MSHEKEGKGWNTEKIGLTINTLAGAAERQEEEKKMNGVERIKREECK